MDNRSGAGCEMSNVISLAGKVGEEVGRGLHLSGRLQYKNEIVYNELTATFLSLLTNLCPWIVSKERVASLFELMIPHSWLR